MECPKCEREINEDEKNCPYCKYDLVNRPKIQNESNELYSNYKKWILGAIVVLVVIIIIAVSMDDTNKTSSTSMNNTNNSVNRNEEKVRENPYAIFNDYDGAYSFLLLDNNGNGNPFDSVGALEISNGICNVKYTIITKDNQFIKEYTGFAGKNEEKFYITIQKGKTEADDIIYKCEFLDNRLLCELVSEYNLSGCYTKKLELVKVNDSGDLNSIYNQKLQEEKLRRKEEETRKAEQEKQTFIDSCQTYTFEQMARNPQNFKGTKVKLTGEVVQVMADSYSTNLRVNITKKGNYSTYYTDTIYVVYHPESGEDKILEDDIITIYGTSQGDCSYKTVMGSEVTLPNIEAKYITIQK